MGVQVVDEPTQEGLQRLVGGERGLQLPCPVADGPEFFPIDRFGEGFPGGEVPVERAGAHAGQLGEVVEAQVEAAVGEEFAGLGDQGVTVAAGIGAQRLGSGTRRLGVGTQRAGVGAQRLGSGAERLGVGHAGASR